MIVLAGRSPASRMRRAWAVTIICWHLVVRRVSRRRYDAAIGTLDTDGRRGLRLGLWRFEAHGGSRHRWKPGELRRVLAEAERETRSWIVGIDPACADADRTACVVRDRSNGIGYLVDISPDNLGEAQQPSPQPSEAADTW